LAADPYLASASVRTARTFDAVFVGLLPAVTNEGGGASGDHSVGIGLEFKPKRRGRSGHGEVRREQHVQRHGLAFSQKFQVTLQAVRLVVYVAWGVLLARFLVAEAGHGILDALQQDVARAGKVNGLVVEIRLRR
jgi:hypothetical protein